MATETDVALPAKPAGDAGLPHRILRCRRGQIRVFGQNDWMAPPAFRLQRAQCHE